MTPASCLTIGLILIVTGCAIHHYDSRTGTEHLWGFGHLRMKVLPAAEGVQAVVRGSDLFGLTIGRKDGQTRFVVGWEELQQVEILTPDAQVRLEWPNSDFFQVRIGTNWPAQFLTDDSVGVSQPESGETQ